MTYTELVVDTDKIYVNLINEDDDTITPINIMELKVDRLHATKAAMRLIEEVPE